MFKKVFIISLFVIFLIFLSVSFVFGQWNPEVNYPEVGGKTITTSTSLPDYIIYIFTLSIIIGAITAVGVLIYGGVLFLTSTGNPTQLKDAKAWISNGFLGLAILLGSYLILNTVNPQLTILHFKFKELGEGVKLIQGGTEKTVGSQVPDIQKKFGENFKPTEIHILGKSVGKIEAKGYSSSSYQGKSTPWIGNRGSVSGFDFIKSLDIRGITPGIYLSKSQADGTVKKSMPFHKDIASFEKSSLDMDNPDYIWIDNGKPEEKNDFAAILYEDDGYLGQCRVMFEKKDRQGFIDGLPQKVVSGQLQKIVTTSTKSFLATDTDNIYVASTNGFQKGDRILVDNSNTYPDYITTITTTTIDNSTSPPSPILKVEPKVKVKQSATITKISFTISGKDEYGTIDKPSSVQVLNIAPQNNCEEVMLYKDPHFSYSTSTPYCEINYRGTWLTNDIVAHRITTTTFPIYQPKNIDDLCGNGWSNSIQSIKIKGNCAVLLFNNTVNYSAGKWQWGDIFDRRTGICELFRSSDYFQDENLSNNLIGRCNPAGIFHWAWGPCASAIAIYPLK